jgi:hypothetical protein
MNRFISINQYRSSTSHGFGNTWQTYRISAADRARMLSEGLPVRDVCTMDRKPVCSTMGIRAATRAERAGVDLPEVVWVECVECEGWNFSR